MYNPMPNFFSEGLDADDEFQQLAQAVLTDLFNLTDKVYAQQPNNFIAKLFANKKQKLDYLLVKQSNKLSVYEERNYGGKSKAFDYTVKELKEHSGVHAREIISLVLEDKADELMAMAKLLNKSLSFRPEDALNAQEKESLEKIENRIKEDPELDKSLMKKIISLYQERFSATSSPYKLKVFFEFLYDQGLMSSNVPDEKWIEKNSRANTYAAAEVEAVQNDINFLFDMCDKHNFTTKNKYSHNDGDNFLYRVEKGIVVESQGMGTYITLIGDNITAYAFDKEGEGFFKHSSLTALLDTINKGEASLVDCVALKINKEAVEYINTNSWYCFSSDLEYTRKSLITNDMGKMPAPIDIQSFEYQVKYARENYQFSKFEFLASRFMIYSSDSLYDKSTGTFKNDSITYSKKVDSAKLEDDLPVPQKFSYCIPMKNIPYLQKDWLEGLEYLVEVLKTHKPIPSVSATDDKLKDVENAAKHFEEMIPRLKKQLEIKPKM